ALDAKAARLADRLRSAGVGSGALVGLCVERSADMAVGLLGVLKAGAAYLPLDPAYPADRLRFLLADAGARLLLTQTHLRANLPMFDGEVMCVDESAVSDQWSAISRTAVLAERCPLTGGRLAYVI